MSKKKIYENITCEDVIKFRENYPPNNILIVKFTAEWCGPCKTIKDFCFKQFDLLPDTIICANIDVDEYIDLYAMLKKKKMVNGIPALLAFYGGKTEHWFIPDDSVVGADEKRIELFFGRCVAQSAKKKYEFR